MSTDDDRCQMSDLPKDQCAHCKQKGQAPKREQPTEIGKVFVAKYRGTCAMDCGDPIVYGDHIAAVDVDDDGNTLYAHYGCMRA